MSSYESAAEIEARRKAALKAQLEASINKLKEQLKTVHSNNVEVTAGAHIVTSVFIADDAAGGSEIQGAVVSAQMLKDHTVKNEEKRDELDFSDLLYSTHKTPSKLELELDALVNRVDERPVISAKDSQDRARVITELAKTLNDAGMDIEDKIRTVKMRVMSYLKSAVRVSEADKERMKERYFEYCALCSMLGMKPRETLPYRVEQEIKRMTAVLEKRNQQEYIMSVIEEAMEELGCHVKEDAVLDSVAGRMFSVDGNPLCDVFVGDDGMGIMFEPVGESKEGSLEKQRQVEQSANKICSMYAELEEKVAEKGVILRRIYARQSQINTMHVQSDVSERRAGKRRKTAGTQKQKSMNPEG